MACGRVLWKGNRMKIIHCADLHLDSALHTHLSPEMAKQRRRELLQTFRQMLEYAKFHDVRAIMIAGDLFDSKAVSALAGNTVLESIKAHPEIEFYYLKGNHDGDFTKREQELPVNLKLFGKTWQSYELTGSSVVISGVELSEENAGQIYDGLVLNEKNFNIVMLHGQVSRSMSNHPENINIVALQYKNIDYLALGHIHSYRCDKLDERGIYCYSGCLEARGLDEVGEHGFVLLEMDESGHSFTQQLIPFGKRSCRQIRVDISGCVSTEEMAQRIENDLKEAAIPKQDMLKLILTGEVEIEAEKDLAMLTERFCPMFYFMKIYDQSTWKVDFRQYQPEASLRGELIRRIQNQGDISEEEKVEMIRYGLLALAGEEIE